MQKLARLLLILSLFTLPLLAQRKLGVVEVAVDKNTIPVRVSANSPELNGLAIQAFRSHGRYTVRASDYAFDIRFSLQGTNQVRVDILRGRETAPAFSQTVSGTSARNALLRAADVAVEKTNGLGLRGFFSAKLAFVGEGSGKKEVYVSDLFLGEVRRITNDRALALSPRWSPDGSRIVYTSYFRSGFPDIFQIDLNTYQRTTFASFRGTNMGARFSPNGQQVAMVLSGSGSPEIWIANAHGGAPVRKTRSDAAKSSPCWSPDGGQLVFAMEPGPQLYVMAAAGGVPQRLRTGYSYSAEPDWSRTDRNKIACTVRSGGYQIAVYDMSQGRASVVSQAPFDGIEPCWLADGRHLVYTARDRSTSVLCILDTETGKSTPLTERSPVGNAMQANVLFGR
jgi:TolB protein